MRRLATAVFRVAEWKSDVALRPLFVEREQRLRWLEGLSVAEPEPLPFAGNTPEPPQALNNPEFQRAYLMELAKR